MSIAALCLAATLWAEARGESEVGKLYVADVIMNRVEDDYFPDTVCEVTQQPAQFASLHGSGDDWQEMINFAESILTGATVLPQSGATHFHTTAINPYWADTMHYTTTVGSHIFYSINE